VHRSQHSPFLAGKFHRKLEDSTRNFDIGVDLKSPKTEYKEIEIMKTGENYSKGSFRNVDVLLLSG
jgi:hypothetical protein